MAGHVTQLYALAPSNYPLISPVAWKAVIDTGGLSVVRGVRALVSDMSSPPFIPAMVAPGAFEIGKDLAVTPGAVVARTDVFELIQYQPATETVHRFPLLVVPPMINKYYIADLAPGRSMLEFFVAQGYQVFVISWRNPGKRHSRWDLNTYGEAVAESLGAACEITQAPKASLAGLCAGGIVSAMLCAQLAATGQLDRVASLFLGVTLVDESQAGTVVALMDEGVAAASILISRTLGYMDGRSLAEVFAWLRPDDLIWNYWVNNYLQGKTPPPFDILYWNADTTRMPAGLHGVDLTHSHSSCHPRPIEVYRGKLVLYRCGDCIDDYEGITGYENYRDDLRLLYFASIAPGTGRTRGPGHGADAGQEPAAAPRKRRRRRMASGHARHNQPRLRITDRTPARRQADPAPVKPVNLIFIPRSRTGPDRLPRHGRGLWLELAGDRSQRSKPSPRKSCWLTRFQ